MPLAKGDTMGEAQKRNAERRAVIIAWLNNNPGFHVANKIAHETGFAPSAVNYLANRMGDQGLIGVKKNGPVNMFSSERAPVPTPVSKVTPIVPVPASSSVNAPKLHLPEIQIETSGQFLIGLSYSNGTIRIKLEQISK